MTTAEPIVVSTAFLDMIKPTRRDPDKPVVENESFVLMLWRMVRALEARAIEDPEMLPQVVALAQRLSEVCNVAIAANAARFHIDPRRGASIAECAQVMGVSKQAASQRRAIGDRIMSERIEAAGAVKFGEAKRERAAVEAAAEHAVTNLADYRARHAA